METLRALEEKIELLIMLVSDLRTENTALKQKNEKLVAQLEAVESSMLSRKADVDELTEEKTLTKQLVDDLIKNIDSLVRNEQQS